MRFVQHNRVGQAHIGGDRRLPERFAVGDDQRVPFVFRHEEQIQNDGQTFTERIGGERRSTLQRERHIDVLALPGNQDRERFAQSPVILVRVDDGHGHRRQEFFDEPRHRVRFARPRRAEHGDALRDDIGDCEVQGVGVVKLHGKRTSFADKLNGKYSRKRGGARRGLPLFNRSHQRPSSARLVLIHCSRSSSSFASRSRFSGRFQS